MLFSKSASADIVEGAVAGGVASCPKAAGPTNSAAASTLDDNTRVMAIPPRISDDSDHPGSEYDVLRYYRPSPRRRAGESISAMKKASGDKRREARHDVTAGTAGEVRPRGEMTKDEPRGTNLEDKSVHERQ
jgi:hypothetical protein